MIFSSFKLDTKNNVNFRLYRFKVGAFFETQCINVGNVKGG